MHIKVPVLLTRQKVLLVYIEFFVLDIGIRLGDILYELCALLDRLVSSLSCPKTMSLGYIIKVYAHMEEIIVLKLDLCKHR